MTSVCYTGPFADASGYGEATRNAIAALHAAGANIKTQRVSFTGNTVYDGPHAELAIELLGRKIDYQIKVIHTTPDVYPKYLEKGKYNIGHLFWETDKLPQGWANFCNQLDEIWTGTKVNAKAIKDSGVAVPVKVFPQSINTDPPEVKPFRIPEFDHKNSLLFYSIFEWNERKNPKALINAYWKAFKGESQVGLVIKTHIGSYGKSMVDKIINEVKRWRSETGWKEMPKLYICTDLLTKQQMHSFHEMGDVFVSAHRGEGWGLPQVEALLHKNPIISTPYGGVHEYLTGKHMKKFKFKMTPIDKVYNRYYEPGMNWADPDEKDLSKEMRKIFDMWSNSKTKNLAFTTGYMGRKLVRSMFNYEEVGRQMLKRLDEIDEDLTNNYGK